MAKVLVTGASGFVGSALVRALLTAREEVHVMVRNKDFQFLSIEGLSVIVHHGDILDYERVAKAVGGMDVVYHTASLYEFLPWCTRQADQMELVNVEGTKNLLNASKQANVTRFVYTSSIFAIGQPTDHAVVDEETPWHPRQAVSHYARTKHEAEQLVLQEASFGFPAIIVNPGMVIGERDTRPTPSGEILIKFLKKRYPAYFDILFCTADVDDIARGHMLAAQKGRLGHKYILCNRQHHTLKEFFGMLEEVSGVAAPKIWLPMPTIDAFIWTDELISAWTRHRPLIPSDGVRLARRYIEFSNLKAINELGFVETPLETTLKKAVQWFRGHNIA